jgi:hypothetical protein
LLANLEGEREAFPLAKAMIAGETDNRTTSRPQPLATDENVPLNLPTGKQRLATCAKKCIHLIGVCYGMVNCIQRLSFRSDFGLVIGFYRPENKFM